MVLVGRADLLGRFVAEDLVNYETGEIYADAGEELVEAKLQALAKKLHGKNEEVMASIGEIERLAKKDAATPDSTEAKARQQIVNRTLGASMFLLLVFADRVTAPRRRDPTLLHLSLCVRRELGTTTRCGRPSLQPKLK